MKPLPSGPLGHIGTHFSFFFCPPPGFQVCSFSFFFSLWLQKSLLKIPRNHAPRGSKKKKSLDPVTHFCKAGIHFFWPSCPQKTHIYLYLLFLLSYSLWNSSINQAIHIFSWILNNTFNLETKKKKLSVHGSYSNFCNTTSVLCTMINRFFLIKCDRKCTI